MRPIQANPLRYQRAVGVLVMLAVALPFLLMLAGCDFTGQPEEGPRDFNNNWQVGATVLLAKGTEIREGPGVEHCWHTVVPENGWEVQVTGGPRKDSQQQDWYDTSRRALGDPSGGTGWVLASQADHFPTTRLGGTQCSYSVQGSDDPDDNWLALLLRNLESWWRSLPIVVQAAVVVIALAVLLWSFRQTSSALVGLLQAVMFGVLIWWVADQTRAQWQGAWQSFAGPGGPDPAFAFALVPLVWWIYNRMRWRQPGALRVALLAALIVVGLLWLAPQRLQGLTNMVQGWFNR